MSVYEMFWDCASCGTRKLLGKSHRRCPECGAPQDASRRYFPAEHEKVAVHDHVYVGRDYECAHCQAPNSRAAKHCVQCGAPIGDDDADVARVAWKAEATAVAPSRFARLRAFAKGRFATRRRALVSILVLAVGAASLCCTCGAITMFWTRDALVQVSGHRWERTVSIDRYSAVDEGAWCDGMPSDAYGVSRSTRERSTRRIPEGEDCSTVNVDNGDGTFSQEQQCTTRYREEPIYDDWCDYTVNRWVHDSSETARGDARAPAPYWPSVSVSDCSSLGCTRVGGRRESYYVRYVEPGRDDDVLECDFSQSKWESIEPGTRWSAEVRVITGGLVCSSLRQHR